MVKKKSTWVPRVGAIRERIDLLRSRSKEPDRPVCESTMGGKGEKSSRRENRTQRIHRKVLEVRKETLKTSYYQTD